MAAWRSRGILFGFNLIGALSFLSRRVSTARFAEDAVLGVQTSGYPSDHVNLMNALDCLDSDTKVLDVIAREVSVMRAHAHRGELERIPGPRIMTAPLYNSFVDLGDGVGSISDKNCIERAQAILALEGEVVELNMAEKAFKTISVITSDSEPWHFLNQSERLVRQSLFDSVMRWPLATFRNEDAEQIFRKLAITWVAYLKTTTREGMEQFVKGLLFVDASLRIALMEVQRDLELARHHEFPLSSSCAPFSQVSFRLARFSLCLSSSGLVPKRDDNKVKLAQGWYRGVYIRTNFSLPFLSHVAAEALKFPKRWHDAVLNLLDETKNHSAHAIAKCAVHLFPTDVGNSEPESPSSQEHQAMTLRCLPALLNAPGFQGVLLESKQKVFLLDDAFAMDKQCVMPPVCGRLGAAILTAWQSRTYGGAGSFASGDWRFENKSGISEVVLGDCMNINSRKSFLCFDYSHYCFPQIMRYMCHALPSCCPSLGGAASQCSALSAEEFARNNTACDVCRQPSHFGVAMRGQSVVNSLVSSLQHAIFGDSPLENEIRQLVQE